MINRQLEEVLSWRFVTEFIRRFPDRFEIIEAHPGGGQYDCLVLVQMKEGYIQFAIDVNRGGSVHIHQDAFGKGGGISTHSGWVQKMLEESPKKLLDEIAREAGLRIPGKLPISTPAVLVYRFIAEFLTHSIGRLDDWECRNGYCDTSGYGGGKRTKLFDAFQRIENDDHRKLIEFTRDNDAYGFWFLLRNDEPFICLHTSGIAYRLDGTSHDIKGLYKHSRRIWPIIFVVAGELLP